MNFIVVNICGLCKNYILGRPCIDERLRLTKTFLGWIQSETGVADLSIFSRLKSAPTIM